ncbi:hypothetical protein [Azotobacter beijerinckii]|uniref:hypothetical protein n=1 Tax=Azotobacter beijerinckii TaxID=170623 RepID=UPI0029551F41|nr:hypothetical protein [Azotobacter beijerinckii]MDV7209923.1 hypothetical protein [Azotobacter beijerinckii]
MSYVSVISAVVRALAAETINSAGGCDFDQKVQADRVPGEISGKEAAFLDDCWVHRRLHKRLSADHWSALCAKYSTHADRKRMAIMDMVRGIKSPAPSRFIECAIVTWAYPKLQGVDGKRSLNVLPAGWYVMDNWCDDPVPVKTQERWRRDIRKSLEQKVDDALATAQEVLDAEGLIRTEAA